jgi:murein DD-endopeptidase MepM/ murein hydrolase activator NlpD
MSRRRLAGLAVPLVALALSLGTQPAPAGDAAAARWEWPLSPPGGIVRPFEAPPGPYAAGHRGIDLAAAAGQRVAAPAAGVVQFAGVVVDRPVVTLRVGARTLVSLEPVAAELPVGAAVGAGEPLGTVAGGGHCGGGCLHVGVRVDGAYVSPLLFLAGVPPAVLLPLE